MWLLWPLLLVLSGQLTAGTSANKESSFSVSPRMFSFQDLPPGNGILSSEAGLLALPGMSACQCRARCLANQTCRGYGTSDASQSCLLTGLLPTPQRMETSAEEWRWHARIGVRLLDEPCEKDADCSLLVPGAVCLKNVCQCQASWKLERDSAGGCKRAGRFINVNKRQLTSGFMSKSKQTSVDDCKHACADNLKCVAVEFSAAGGLCRMYADGVTNEATSSGDTQSFVWNLEHADGTPPDTYQQVGNAFLRVLQPGIGLKAADACFLDGAILFPDVTKIGLSPLKNYITKHAETENVWIGLEDMLEEGRYVTSDGREMAKTDINWIQGQPDDLTVENCATVGKLLFVHDYSCSSPSFNSLCQYVGENLALRKNSWMNAERRLFPASNGNDGNEDTFIHSPDDVNPYPTWTWTVDLGDRVQVTSVLYVARVDCCPNNRNRLTEIRVGSDPANFDDQHSARCVWLEKPFVIQGYARLFRCAVPLTGRYVRLIRDGKVELDFAELAVFGNRLQ